MKGKLLGLVASLFMFAAAPCHAVTVYVTYTGTVSSGVDNLGLFGPVNADLTGSAYTASYVFDVAFGQNNYNLQSATLNHIYGGSAFSPPHDVSPSMGASLTIAGFSQFIGGSYFGSISGRNDGGVAGFAAQSNEVASASADLYFYIFNSLGASSGLPAAIDSAFSYTVLPGDTAVGLFHTSGSNFIYLTPETLTVSLTAPGATPLPAALPLFASGLGGLGLLGWRRKRKAQART